MSVKTKRAFWLGSAVAIAVASLATSALADEADASKVKITEGVQVAQASGTPAPAAKEEKPEEKKVERVVVTGSRLKKSEYTSSAPIQVITREETTLQGLNDTADILQGSTIAGGAQQINNTFGGFVTDGGPGANTVGLRGLDPKRTLILVNGRRLTPAGTRGSLASPDLNTIPESIVERAEILKDGGSPIYGSDAIVGVINIITRKNFDGAEIQGRANISEHGGAETWQGNAMWGETFDRGQIMLAGEYYHREPLRFSDRDYLGCPQDNVRNFTTGALLDLIDPATGQSKCFNSLEGVVDLLAGPGGRYIPTPGLVAGGGFLASLSPFAPNPAVPGAQPDRANLLRVGHSFTATNTYINNLCVVSPAAPFCATAATRAAEAEARWRASQIAVTTNDPRQQSTTVISPVTRYAFFGQGSYDLMPGAELYGEAQFTRRESEQERWRQLFPNVSATNPNNPHGFTARSIVLVPTNAEQTVDYYRAVLGVRGDLSDKFPIFGGWSYDFYVQHQRSEADYTNDIIYNDRVLATTAAGTACNQALITISGGSCASIPGGVRWFDTNVVLNGAWNAAEQAFLFTKETGHTTFTETLAGGSVTGDVFELPAGAVSAALGAEWRTDEIDDTPSFNARNNNLWGQTSAGRTAGSDTVREFFAEANVPLLAGKSFAEKLEIDAAWRYTDYDSYGEDTTYKLGLNWQITPEYRLRATTGTSFRAPALFEQFLANQTGFLGQTAIDPCGFWDTSGNAQIIASCGPLGLNLPPGYNPGVYPSALILSGGGGPGVLSAERSENRTVGFVWTPDWIDFSAAIDYWELEVNNEVGQFGAANILNACHTNPPFPTSPFCGLFVRDTNPASPTFGMILTVNDSFVNISNEATDGLDLATRYEHEFSFGRLRVNGDFSWFFTRELKTFPNQPTNDDPPQNGQAYFPDFIGRVNAAMYVDDWTFFAAANMQSRASDDEFFGGSVFNWRGFTPVNGNAQYKQYTEFFTTYDASVRYRMEDWTFQMGVQNLLDEQPATVSTGGAAFGRIGNSAGLGSPIIDIVGRRGFLSVTKEF